MSDRLNKLLTMLEREPRDAFLLYGVALEYKKMNEPTKAVEFLDRVIAVDPGYCYAYHQKGLTFESTGDLESAKRAYRDGISAAQRKGDAHAAEEIGAALSLIE